MREIRNVMYRRLDGTLTFWFRATHPDITKRIENVMVELERVEFNYLNLYYEYFE